MEHDAVQQVDWQQRVLHWPDQQGDDHPELKRNKIRVVKPNINSLREEKNGPTILWRIVVERCQYFMELQWMTKYQTGLVFRQMVLVPFPDSLDSGRCLKSKLENPEPNTVSSYKSIRTGSVQFKWPKSFLKSEFPSVQIST